MSLNYLDSIKFRKAPYTIQEYNVGTNYFLIEVPGYSLNNNSTEEKAAVIFLITLCDKNQGLFTEKLISSRE